VLHIPSRLPPDTNGLRCALCDREAKYMDSMGVPYCKRHIGGG